MSLEKTGKVGYDMFCRNCGNQLGDCNKFCTSCGEAVEFVVPRVVESQRTKGESVTVGNLVNLGVLLADLSDLFE